MNNLALNKPSWASGYVSPFSAARAVDGNLAPIRRWLCNAMPCWLEVDLGAPYWIDRWILKHMGAAGWSSSEYNMKNFKLQGSMDYSTWVDLDVVSNNSASVTDRTFNAAQARYVRVYVTAGLNTNNGVASIAELEVYESPYNPYLSVLTISSGTLKPAFNEKTFSYSAKVGSEVESVTVTPTAQDANAAMKVNGLDVTSGQPSQPITLQPGDNTVTVAVTNGPITQDYTIKVTKQTAVAYLSGLVLTAMGRPVALDPAFNKDQFNYTASVANTVTSVTVTPTAEQSGSTIKVNDAPVTSGQPSQPINLSPGSNTITIQVTPAVGGNPTTYTITVTRAS